jgi:hypothetical protein
MMDVNDVVALLGAVAALLSAAAALVTAWRKKPED